MNPYRDYWKRVAAWIGVAGALALLAWLGLRPIHRPTRWAEFHSQSESQFALEPGDCTGAASETVAATAPLVKHPTPVSLPTFCARLPLPPLRLRSSNEFARGVHLRRGPPRIL